MYICMSIYLYLENGVYYNMCLEEIERDKGKKYYRKKERERDQRPNFLLNLSKQNYIIYRRTLCCHCM